MRDIVEQLRDPALDYDCLHRMVAANEIETLRQRVKELETELATLNQILTDPENQPNQFGVEVAEAVANIGTAHIFIGQDDMTLKQAQGEPVFVVFDGAPGHVAPGFIEVENAEGKSVSVDSWHEYPKDIATANGLWRLGPLYTSAPTIPAEREIRYAPDYDYYRVDVYHEGYDEGWNACRKSMLSAAPKPGNPSK